jgi:hypothetical protein
MLRCDENTRVFRLPAPLRRRRTAGSWRSTP